MPTCLTGLSCRFFLGGGDFANLVPSGQFAPDWPQSPGKHAFDPLNRGESIGPLGGPLAISLPALATK